MFGQIVSAMSTDRMPVGFIGHGNPMNVVMEGRAEPWRRWARSLPTPKAVLTVSAHWEDAPVTIGRTRDHTELLYDFWGFPEFMYRIRYPAPGAPALADRVEALLAPHLSVARADRAIDHGAWCPLIHLFPEADVPVLQISMPMDLSERALVALGAELSPLRDEGVFILATGNLVHDLRHANLAADPEPPPYAEAFDAWVASALERGDGAALESWREAAPDALRSHPSAEHYRPILVAAGAARGDQARFPVEGFEHGTISRRCVVLD
ncbi:MAG TPA: class III extradiol ring-cleavage dioxygenase [Actinomycetota bacterium]|nr:class III extradiol ring-cleavage dioxygenase [Actinomycetota bacterium]